MNVRQAFDSVIPSALAERVKELLAQSKRYQMELTRVTDELSRLHQQIADMAGPNQTNAAETARPLGEIDQREA